MADLDVSLIIRAIDQATKPIKGITKSVVGMRTAWRSLEAAELRKATAGGSRLRHLESDPTPGERRVIWRAAYPLSGRRARWDGLHGHRRRRDIARQVRPRCGRRNGPAAVAGPRSGRG